MKHNKSKTKVRKTKIFPTFTEAPIWNITTNKWINPDFEVRECSYGYGVYAKKDLPEKRCFYYGGRKIDSNQRIKLLKRASEHNIVSNYIAQADFVLDLNGKMNVTTWLNADQSLLGLNANKGLWIGGQCNEASSNSNTENYNARIVLLRQHKGMPNWPETSRDICLFVQTQRPIKKDEQIFIWYGYSKTIYKRLRYDPKPKPEFQDVDSEDEDNRSDYDDDNDSDYEPPACISKYQQVPKVLKSWDQIYDERSKNMKLVVQRRWSTTTTIKYNFAKTYNSHSLK